MFRLNRHKSDRLGERVEFKFSNFQAFKAIKTGKTIAKSNKVTVRSGTCQWTESLSESFGLSQDGRMKELEELKFVVSMGIGRGTMLGEVVVNLADHIDSSDSGPLTLPLINCSYGTILQVKIQCFNPKTRFRDGNALRGTNARRENLHASSVEADNKSDTSDNMNYKSAGSTFSNNSIAEGSEKKDAICLPSGSHGSSDSTVSSLGRAGLTPRNTVNDSTSMGRQDSAGSQASATSSSGLNGALARSNPSSFNSRASGSSTPHQWQDSTMQTIEQGHAAQSLGTSVSAKELLEAAEETIDELRDEAKMWERHAQKLKIDLEKLKKECTYKSKQLAELELELSAANNERDSLRQEVKQLKLSLEQIKISRMDNYSYKNESILHSQKQLEDELKFLKESNASLIMQLNKSQEANLELVAILEELEETVEKQRIELANLTCSTSMSENVETMRDHAFADAEEEWARKLSAKEEEISKLEEKLSKEEEWARKLSAKEEEISKLEEKLSKLQNVMHVRAMVSNHDHPDLMQEEVEDLRTKVEELERDCNELTQENLELIFKLKELGKDVDEQKDLDSCCHVMHGNHFPYGFESDVRQLKFQISRLEDALSKRGMDGFFNIEPSMLLVEKLKKNCADLDFELQYVKDHACDPDIKFGEFQVEVEEKVLDINELQQKPNCIEDTNLGYSSVVTEQGLEIVKSRITLETPKMLYEMKKQLQLALFNVRYLNSEQHPIGENSNEMGSNVLVSRGEDAASQEELVEDMLNDIIKLNSSLQAKVVKCRDIWPIGGGIMEKDLIFGRSEVVESGTMDKQQNEELEGLKLRNEELEAAFLLKEKEIDALEASMRELEHMILSIRREKSQVEENLAVVQKENNVTSKYVDDVQNEMVILNNDMCSHGSDNDKLNRKSSEHEIGKHEPELQMSELAAENSQLSERISGLEAQISFLIDEKERTRLEVEGYKSLIGDLYVETAEQKAKIEEQNVERGKIYQEVQHELSEARVESEMLKKTHSELQCTVESLIEECSSLKQQTENLQRQKLEMHAQSLDLVVEIRELQTKNSGYLLEVEVLESKLSSLQSDFTLKEESVASVLENMLQEQKELREMINEADVMLKQINEEKMTEIENLKEEVSHLSAQVYSSQDERERLAADALREVSTLHLEKN
ncbi:hypothetical protein HPP92_008296 [Vanilla planifolia]|uniref:C2 NT-type domain-containing protein n=1 Tax=Vanilla planifolia TaxID=51239 RepID=A0A835R5R3_VANPL|nr:hypothetical protein HPP92_008296 [Vanilla planifolia]